MADPNPNQPPGAVPPKPPEGAKVQPKKETVRIALPPKPTAAPTIKLPSLPPTGAAPATAPAPAAPPASAAPTAARPASAAAPTTQIPRPAAAPAATAPTAATRPGTTVARPAAPAPGKAPAPAPKPASAPRTVGTLDTALAVAAMVIGIIALLSVLFLVMGPFESGFLSAIK